VDNALLRSDIRIDPTDDSIKAGVPLLLTFRVLDVTDPTVCKPLPDAQVDIWHCDAQGVYSGVEEGIPETAENLWLRGYQITDEYGEATFTTVYPGWYPGRTVHIHFKVRTDPTAEQGYEFTSQLFFPEVVSDAVYEEDDYARGGGQRTSNSRDNIYREAGEQLLLTLTETEEGYAALFDIGLDLSDAAVGADDGF
jgi:protocatechuate 3,4-dioxygenase beta subunit